MIRVVLDTNVLISALLRSHGPPSEVFLMAIQKTNLQLCVSGAIYAEYEEVLRRPRFQRSEEEINATLRAIRESGLWVVPTEQLRVCLDPDDNIFLECAKAAGAGYLITGNVRHFPAAFGSTKVITARQLLNAVL